MIIIIIDNTAQDASTTSISTAAQSAHEALLDQLLDGLDIDVLVRFAVRFDSTSVVSS